MMNFNFELILFYAVLITGAIALLDVVFFAKHRKQVFSPGDKKMPLIIEYARSFFPVLLLVFVLRSFLFEPFRIPSSSLEPTLLVGDFVLVNKYHYGVRLPVIHQKVIAMSEPQRGDIFVFRYPPKPQYDFIKRVIGLPGDHIKYIDKTLYINGQEMVQTPLADSQRMDEEGNNQPLNVKEENLFGVKHRIYQNKNFPSENFEEITVPKGMYFAMGDNRDDSADSRFWGFVPEENIVGKASLTWMSWDKANFKLNWDAIKHVIRWDRVGKFIH
jgi:signal peptidase I